MNFQSTLNPAISFTLKAQGIDEPAAAGVIVDDSHDNARILEELEKERQGHYRNLRLLCPVCRTLEFVKRIHVIWLDKKLGTFKDKRFWLTCSHKRGLELPAKSAAPKRLEVAA